MATGDAHSVRDFVELAFGCVGRDVEWCGSGLDEKGLDGRTGSLLVEIDRRYFRPTEVDFLLGDASKARKRLGWTPKVPFPALVKEMVEAELAPQPIREDALLTGPLEPTNEWYAIVNSFVLFVAPQINLREDDPIDDRAAEVEEAE